VINIKRLSVIALILLIVGTVGSILTFRIHYKTPYALENKVIKERVTAINIHTDNVDTEIIPTNDSETRIKVYGRETPDIKLIFSADVEENTLSIKLKEKQEKMFNFDFFPLSFKLKVYVPEKQYETLQVHNDNGQVKIGKLTVKNMIASTNNGQLQFNHVNATNIDVQSDNGAIHFLGDITGKMVGRTNNGKISLITPNIDYPIQLESDNGGIMIQTEKEPTNVTYEVQVDNGSINIFDKYKGSTVVGNGDHKIKLTTNNGEITIKR
jgi:DUF4097 and DUF4098 domain-containing protein YvlB